MERAFAERTEWVGLRDRAGHARARAASLVSASEARRDRCVAFVVTLLHSRRAAAMQRLAPTGPDVPPAARRQRAPGARRATRDAVVRRVRDRDTPRAAASSAESRAPLCQWAHAAVLGERSFPDAVRGERWTVRELDAGPGASRSLVFESAAIVRRFTSFPADWATLTDDALLAFGCRDA